MCSVVLDPLLPHAAAAKSLQSCPTLCDLIDGSPPGFPVPGILQARTLEWVAISFSNAWKWKAKVKLLSHVWLLVTPWTVAHQAPLSMGFSRQEYWSGVPLPSPWTVVNQAPLSMGFSRQDYWSGLLFPPSGDLPDPGIKPTSYVSPVLAGEFFTAETPGKPINFIRAHIFNLSKFITLSQCLDFCLTWIFIE